MRRALLTARALVPLTIGNTDAFGTLTFGSGRTLVDLSGPANGPGTITEVKVGSAADDGVIVMIGTFAGGSFTVRAVSPGIGVAVGLNTLTVSLPVVAGDLIGFWFQTSTSRGQCANDLGKQIGYSNFPNLAPTVGSVIGLTTATDKHLAILGTG